MDSKAIKINLLRSSKSEPISSSGNENLSLSITSSIHSSQSAIELPSIDSSSWTPRVFDFEIKSFPNLAIGGKTYSNQALDDNIVLNEELLATLNPADTYADLLHINVRGLQLRKVNRQFLKDCRQVIGIDAGENKFELDYFRNCAELQELLLPLNHITQVTMQTGDFPKLKYLDLSCNNLTPTAIYTLGQLSTLKILNLTCNNIEQLPGGLSAMSFPLLETLILDYNHITHPNNFRILSRLPSLVCLSMEHNKISYLPFIETKATGNSILRAMKTLGLDISSVEAVYKNKSKPLDKKAIISVIKGSEKFKNFIPLPVKKSKEKKIGIYLKDEKNETIPFPRLRQLNLTRNKLEDENDLLPVMTWSRIRELVINKNKLSSLKSIHLERIKNYLVPYLSMDYSQFSCRVYDPKLDPFQNKGLIHRFRRYFMRDANYCFCHTFLKRPAEMELHTPFNLDPIAKAVPGVKSLPLPSQRLCHYQLKQSEISKRKANHMSIWRTRKALNSPQKMSDACYAALESVAPSTLPSTVHAVRVALAKIMNPCVSDQSLISNLSNETSIEKSKPEDSSLFTKTLRLDLLNKLKFSSQSSSET